ncbi:MAG: hypothetical protein L0Y50_00420, partial [Beijerinckiaceae bacterium]|nr:hypothetical protein [Beijerinckiaceae bacterium]
LIQSNEAVPPRTGALEPLGAGGLPPSRRHGRRDRVPMASLRLLLRLARMVAVLAYAWAPVPASCAEQRKPEASRPAEARPPASDIKQFCANNLAIAGDARIAWQTSKLRELETQINQRIAELENRKAQLIEWLRKHDEAVKKAGDGVIAIYAQMKPYAAASHLAAMDDAIAAAILAKLPPRAASAILNEMEPARAAQLTNGLVAPNGKKS